MAAFLHQPSACLRLHFEIAPLDVEYRVASFESDLSPGERQDEVWNPKVSLCAANYRPLLRFGEERTINAAANPILEKELRREFRRHRRLAVLVLELREDLSRRSLGKLPIH